MNAADIRTLVRKETDRIRDPAVREGLLRIVVSPTSRLLAWDVRGDYGAGTMDIAFERRDERPDARDCHVVPRRWTDDRAR